MGIRMTGLISNMDTESVVEALMEAHRTKLTKIENKKTKLEWTQEKWKDLNTKLYKLYQEQTSKLHLTSGYSTRKATSADESVVKVTASKEATQGTHNIIVKQLASSQYMTGEKLTGNIKGSTKLSSLDSNLVGTKIDIVSATGSKSIDITDSTTINDFTNACKKAGLNASFDEKQGRFFISSKESGADQSFSITTNSYGVGSPTLAAKNEIVALGGTSVYDALNNIEAKKSLITDPQSFIDGVLDGTITSTTISGIADATEKSIKQSIFDSVNSIVSATNSKAETALKNTITSEETELLSSEIKDKIKNSEDGFFEKTITVDGVDKTLRIEIPKSSDLTGAETDDDINAMVKDALKKSEMKELLNYKVSERFTDSEKERVRSEAQSSLKTSMDNYVNGAGATVDADKLNALGLGTGCKTVAASDSIFIYNDAELTSSTNTLTANGLTMEAVSVSTVTEKDIDGNPTAYKATSISVSNDTEAVYKSIKDFLTSYNSILKEMNELYYADSSRGYDPLTDEEKEAMTDDQIEKWETKIKDSLLRRDTTVGGITSAMKSAMQSVVEVNGKKYSLSSFGIMTSKDYTEKGLLHIYGDKEDSTYSDKQDKLLKAINEDPELVAKVMAGIVDELHSTLFDKMSKTSLSSALTFYNDKQMANQVTKYKKDISTMEKKLKEKEDAYYKQFTAMEKAMASLQSQQNSLAGLLGNN
ncbi:flagellar filament capping protein FliD [Anaerosporobacter faecicola]|uniref:flagellar filament capping protein FliD n=1 Tax=Anaerosporobacter faecicola TaxID=2718714 RepID=UPI001438F8F8|nr:flagellar filament capping protein FliD [Anaerosporobacter faecicola]